MDILFTVVAIIATVVIIVSNIVIDRRLDEIEKLLKELNSRLQQRQGFPRQILDPFFDPFEGEFPRRPLPFDDLFTEDKEPDEPPGTGEEY